MEFALHFLQAARDMMPYFPGLILPMIPSARFLAAYRGDARYWPWLRMQVLRRDGYRCRSCGCPGDEITLQVCPAKTQCEHSQPLVTLCPRCQSAVAASFYQPHRSPLAAI